MHIATAKPTPQERAQIPHHLIDFLPFDRSFSAAEYVKLAADAVQDIVARGKRVILCGGTGMYADAFLSGMSFSALPGAKEKREELSAFYKQNGADALTERLRNVDPEAAAFVDLANPKRVIRALEICECSGQGLCAYMQCNLAQTSPYDALRLVLDFRDRAVLYDRINERVNQMVRNGLVEEAHAYYQLPQTCTASQAIGYKELKPYFDGDVSFEEAIENLKRATRRYAKRQQTWFKRDADAVHIYMDESDCMKKAIDCCDVFWERTDAGC